MSTCLLSTTKKYTPVADGADGCACQHHAIIAPASGQFPHCKFSEQLSLYETPMSFGTYPNKYVNQTNPIVLMKLDGFAIEKNTPNAGGEIYNQTASWVTHLCPTAQWKIVIDSQWVLKNETCFACSMEVPPGIIALWKMHAWESLKDIADQPQFSVDLMDTEVEWGSHFAELTGPVTGRTDGACT